MDDFRFNIKSGGVIEELNANGLIKGIGTWTLTGNVFVAHYKFMPPLNTIYSVKATYDAATKKLTGTRGFDSSVDDIGIWYMTKVGQ